MTRLILILAINLVLCLAAQASSYRLIQSAEPNTVKDVTERADRIPV